MTTALMIVRLETALELHVRAKIFVDSVTRPHYYAARLNYSVLFGPPIGPFGPINSCLFSSFPVAQIKFRP